MAITVVVALVFLFGCNKSTGNGNVPASAYVVKNPALLSEVGRLEDDSATNSITVADTAEIAKLSKDPVEQFYAKEFTWLVTHNDSDHYNHPLTFLDWYLRTGNETFCAPHELGHLAAYITAGDLPYAEETLAVIRQKTHLWDEKQEINRQKYPQFYSNVITELKPMMNDAMARLDRKDYGNETIELLEQIDSKSVC